MSRETLYRFVESGWIQVQRAVGLLTSLPRGGGRALDLKCEWGRNKGIKKGRASGNTVAGKGDMGHGPQCGVYCQ